MYDLQFSSNAENWLLRVIGICAIAVLSTVVIYSNDPYGLIGTMAGFFLYIFVFHAGHMIEKVTAVLVFCPVMIAVNYLMEETGKKNFLYINKGTSQSNGRWMDL